MATWKDFMVVYRVLPTPTYVRELKREFLDKVELPADWADIGSWFFLKKWAEENNYRVERLSTDFIGERIF